MDRGKIPGYYYDGEKKKYFKIQANHLAPPEAKYAKSNVKREQRQVKKRKVDDRSDARRRQQTVAQAPALRIASVALSREIGLREPSDDQLAKDAFFVSQLQPSTVQPLPEFRADAGRFYQPHPTGESGRMILAEEHSYRDRPGSVHSLCISYPHPEGRKLYKRGAMPRIIVGFIEQLFSSAIISISTGNVCPGYRQPFVVCARLASTNGNVRCGSLSDLVENDEDPYGATVRLSLGGAEGSLWAAAMQPATVETAIAGTEEVYVVDGAANLKARRAIARESRAIAWLNQDTVVFGQPAAEQLRTTQASVHLWDVRSSGAALRFLRPKQQHCARALTGILNPDDSGVHILASDNTGFSLYDTRMNDQPLLSFRHVHQGPRLDFTAFQKIVAAVDADNLVQFYSLRSGRRLGTQRSHLKSSALLSDMRFHGSTLLACQDGHVLQWSYGGAGEDDE